VDPGRWLEAALSEPLVEGAECVYDIRSALSATFDVRRVFLFVEVVQSG